MKKLNLTGSYFDMGYKYGLALRKSGFIPPPVSSLRLDFIDKSRKIISRTFPEILEEIEGISKGGDFDHNLINALALTLEGGTACTVFTLRGGITGGHVVFCRNYDFLQSLSKYSELYRTHALGSYKNLGCSDIFVGREDGINEKGLAIGVTYVWYKRAKPGIIFPLAVKMVLDKCSGVREVLDLLVKIKHMRNANFLVADKKGDIAIVQASPEKVKASLIKGEHAIITNHFLSTAMKVYEDTKNTSKNSFTRLNKFSTWIKRIKMPLSLGTIERFLLDHKEGVCQLPSTREDDQSISTLWSWISQLGKNEILLSTNPTDRSSFQRQKI